MSLIRARRERRELGGSGPRRPPSAARLLLLFIFVLGLIWWLTRFTG